MSNMSPNMIYKVYQKYIGKSSFKDWIDHEKNVFASRKQSGKITTNQQFPQWLNKKYSAIFKNKGIEIVQNAEGKFKAFLKKLGEGAKAAGKKIITEYELTPKEEEVETEAPKGTVTTPKKPATPKPSNDDKQKEYLLGLSKPVFITLVSVAGLVVIVGLTLWIKSLDKGNKPVQPAK